MNCSFTITHATGTGINETDYIFCTINQSLAALQVNSD